MNEIERLDEMQEEQMFAAIQHSAKKGAEVMDLARPGWAEKLKTDLLAMHDCHHCILGQLYGWYYDGVQALVNMGFIPEEGFYRRAMEEEYGFCLYTIETEDGGEKLGRAWEELNLSWIEEIARRTNPTESNRSVLL